MHTIHEARRALQELGMVDGLAAEQVDEHLGRYLRLDDVGRRGLAYYLCEVQARRLYQSFGYSSTMEYALHRHDLSARRTRELLHAGAHLRELPLIDEAFCSQEITWSKVVLLLRVAGAEHEAAWLDRARALGISALKREVRLARRGSPPRDPDDTKGLPEVRFPLQTSLGVVPHEMLETAQKKLTAERGMPATVEEVLELALGLYLDMERKGEAPGWNHVPSSHYRIHVHPASPDGGEPLLVQSDDGLYPLDGAETDGPLAAQRSACACCDGEHVAESAEPFDRPTPPALRRRVLARDGHRCRCCGSRSQLHVHHIVLRSRGGRTQAHNLLTLCARCHALVHAGLLAIVGRTTKKARFVDREGLPIHGPDRSLDRARLLRAATPRPPSPSAPIPTPAPPFAGESGVARSADDGLTLAGLPDVVDGAWLRRHAGSIRCSREGGFELRPGLPSRGGVALAECAPALDVGGEGEAGPPVGGEQAFVALVGRDDLLTRLRVEQEGAVALGEPFPHTLVTGPAGAGKTTLATGVARLVGARLVRMNGPLVGEIPVLLRLLASLRKGDVLFLDEVHAVPQTVLEVLYEAMADGRISLTFHESRKLGTGTEERAVRLELPAFTVLAATTAPSKLDRAFVSRFGVREHLPPLAREDLALLATSSARSRGFEITSEAAGLLAAHARGTPRELLRLVERVVRFAAARGDRLLEGALAAEVLVQLGYDAEGCGPLEQRCVALLRDSEDPISERRLASLLGVDRETLTQEIEPWLLTRGLIRITRHGRVPTQRRTGAGAGVPPQLKPFGARRNSAARLTLVGSK